MTLSFKDVEKILAIVADSDCEEVRLEFGDLKLHLQKRGTAGATGKWDIASGAAAQPLPGADNAPPAPDAAATTPSIPRADVLPEGVVAVSAPMLGTFYRAPSPGAKPFVTPGDTVSADDTVCLLEVMKLFNSVKAGIAGTVESVLVENGALVEYAQPLVLIRPTA